MIILLNVKLLLDLFDSLDSDVASSLETVSYLERVDTLVEKSLSLLKESTSEDDDTSGTITDFVVL